MPVANEACLHVYIEGRVQGVGFRQSCCDEARRHGLGGWVRNLPDGRVEAVFKGPKDQVDEMLAWCRRGPGPARVDRVVPDWQPAERAPHTFSVR